VKMMAIGDAGFPVAVVLRRWKHPLPGPGSRALARARGRLHVRRHNCCNRARNGSARLAGTGHGPSSLLREFEA
jgi:hypothetical protein